MAAPSAIVAALNATDRSARTARMAEVMARCEASYGACTHGQLMAEGFVEAEIGAYFDDALAILAGRPLAAETTPATASARAEGFALVEIARAIKARAQGGWRRPIVIEAVGAHV